jgi:hypothetical protein
MRRAGRSYRVDGTIGRDFVRRKQQVAEGAVEFRLRHKTLHIFFVDAEAPALPNAWTGHLD